jgi:hypothetical protein
MCVFAIFYFYLLVMVGTRIAVTHDRYLHDNLVAYEKAFGNTQKMSYSNLVCTNMIIRIHPLITTLGVKHSNIGNRFKSVTT